MGNNVLRLTKKQWDSMPKGNKGYVSNAVRYSGINDPRLSNFGRAAGVATEDRSFLYRRTLILNGKMLVEGLNLIIEGSDVTYDDDSLI